MNEIITMPMIWAYQIYNQCIKASEPIRFFFNDESDMDDRENFPYDLCFLILYETELWWNGKCLFIEAPLYQSYTMEMNTAEPSAHFLCQKWIRF